VSNLGFKEDLSFPAEIDEIRSLVETEFIVEDVRIEFGVLAFTIRFMDSPKKSFERLVEKMKSRNLVPMLRKRNGFTTLYVVSKPKIRETKVRTNLILLVITTITIFLSGYFNSIPWTSIFGGNPLTHAIYFTIALLAIVGFHEIGHKVVCWIKHTEATLPYFIPGPPYPIGFGTFGAVIMQKEPPINRDQLFDLGFSGPIVSFILAVVVAIIATQSVQPVDPALLEEKGVSLFTIPINLAWMLIFELLKPFQEGQLVLMPPIGWAAWLGFIITFLNLLPIWQLDGGHIASALFGKKGVKIASMVGLVVTFVTGFWFFGLLILFLSAQSRRAEPLDEVSPLASSRKILGVVAYLVLAFSAVFLWF